MTKASCAIIIKKNPKQNNCQNLQETNPEVYLDFPIETDAANEVSAYLW